MMIARWIKIAGGDTLLNMELVERVRIQGNDQSHPYAFSVIAQGQIGAWWDHEERDVRSETIIYGGTLEECQQAIGFIGEQIVQAYVLSANGTRRPEPEFAKNEPPYVPADYSDIPF